MNAIESTGVAVLGLNSYCVELVLRSVGDQHVSEATVIRFLCSSERIEKFGGTFLWEMKCHSVCPFSIARVRVDNETLCSALYSGREFRRQHGLLRSRRDTLGGISFPKRRTRRMFRFIRTSTRNVSPSLQKHTDGQRIAIQVQHSSSSTRGRRHLWSLKLRSLRQIQI